MIDAFNLRVLTALRLYIKAACIITVIAGLSVLIGWYFDIQILKSVGPQFNSMNVNTAIAFILSGCSLWLLEDQGIADMPL